jgi:hypothetical protein
MSVFRRRSPQMKRISLFAALVASSSIHAALVDIPLAGNTSLDQWDQSALIATANPGFPGNPGSGPWPNPIAPNVGGGASLVKTSDGPFNPSPFPHTGGPYPGGQGIYFGGYSPAFNLFGGSVAVQDATPLLNVNTIVFQIVIGEAFGFDFYNGEFPTLVINGDTEITLSYSSLFDQAYKGEQETPEGLKPVYWNTYGFQWDLSGVTDPITSIEINISAVQHAQITGLKLQQSSAVYTDSVLPAPIPEPSTGLLLGMGLVLAWRASNRKRNS